MNRDEINILNVNEAAELLRIPISSVYKLAQEGKIPSQKVGRHWRFHRQTLVNWIAKTGIRFSETENHAEPMEFN